MSAMFGDAMRVIGSDQGSGREYLCPCGWTGFSVWGAARNHSHICPEAWTAGAVPDGHSGIRSTERGRGPCPYCHREIAYRVVDHPYDRVRVYAHHKTNGHPCPLQRWDEHTHNGSGWNPDGSFMHRQFPPETEAR